ncbi:DUF1583 domain-containing protein [Novipirellula caenicola]|uniref:3-keto-disaccharide hydrolase domain-containing protein n=1 Tax=Novipirellula caenicola TaxID=1536901 RepID=A0ABP9VWM7_9BACT
MFLILMGFVTSGYGQAAEPTAEALPQKSDGRATDALFAEQHIPESGMLICDRARSLPRQHAFELLTEWVLPNDQHSHFRVTSDYVAPDNTSEAASSTQSGGRIVSPAIMWLRLANELEKIDATRTAITQCRIDSPRNQCNQTALVALLAIEEGNIALASDLLEKLFSQALSDPELLNESRQAILLCADQAGRSPELSAIVIDPVQMVIQHYVKDIHRTAWHRHLEAAFAKLVEQSQQSETVPHASVLYAGKLDATQWHPVSRSSAMEHGYGYPAANWHLTAGSARKLSSHSDDFLFFASPLQGHFDIETDVTGFGYRDTQLMIAGQWTGLIYDHRHYAIGNISGELKRFAIDPPMQDTHGRGTIHVRTTVRETEATTHFNARPIHVQPLPSRRDPWIAIRSPYNTHGGVDDLRITGSPTVPESIPLVTSPELTQWYDYFSTVTAATHRLTDWKGSVPRQQSGNAATEITDARAIELPPGSSAERLLVYSRPMIEDGSIEYEFWYTPGETIAHPAVGRNCYLLGEQGVRLHRLTDGRYERSSLRSDNASEVSHDQPTLSLLANSWNKMRVEVAGDQLRLLLNAELVYESTLQSDRLQRRFGLFHYADRSDLRVRNPHWTGDWPKQIPELDAQELAVYANAELDRTAEELPELFVQEINAQSILERKFTVVTGNASTDVQSSDDGVRLLRDGQEGYSGTLLGAAVDVGGDFDVVLSYDQFEYKSDAGKVASVQVYVRAKNEERDVAAVQCTQGRDGTFSVQCMKMQTINGEDRRHYFGRYPTEASAGRIRICRRENKIHYLHAENDSTQFQLIGENDFSGEDLQDLGIQFGVQIQGAGGYSRVRFTKIEIRAERLSGLATASADAMLAKFNEQREQLPDSFHCDFRNTPLDENDFHTWGNLHDWNQSTGGVLVDSPGTDHWTSAGISLKHIIQGDFDITFAFEPNELAVPQEGDYTQIYLQVETSDADRTQFNAMLVKSPRGGTVSQAQSRTRNAQGYSYNRLGSLGISTPDYLRLLRRGKKIYFYAGVESKKHEYLIGMTSAPDVPLNPFGVRLMLHTGGSDRKSQMLVKSLDVKANQLTRLSLAPVANSVPSTTKPRPTVPPTKSLPTRLFESVRGLFQ